MIKYSRSQQQEDALLMLCGAMALDALVQILMVVCMLFLAGLKLVSALATLALALFSFLMWLVGQWTKGFEEVEIRLRLKQSEIRR